MHYNNKKTDHKFNPNLISTAPLKRHEKVRANILRFYFNTFLSENFPVNQLPECLFPTINKIITEPERSEKKQDFGQDRKMDKPAAFIL